MSEGQKFPFIRAINNVVQNGAEDQAMLNGRSLPCHVVSVSGQIVTVQFDMLPDGVQYPQVTIPIATFTYIRYPIQKGDKGVTVAADVSLRGVSGLGTGIADRSFSFSLVPLFFVPLSNAGWSEEDPNKIVLYGPDGAILKTESGGGSVTVTDDDITINAGKSITLNAGASITLSAGGQTLTLAAGGANHNGVDIGETHIHLVSGVMPGSAIIPSEVPQ